eukprot:2144685-Pyramimonas_sp.AAC.1
MMGFPVSLQHQMRSGVAHSYSRGVAPPASRTIRSQQSQIGHSMHVNAVGGCTLLVTTIFQNLGSRHAVEAPSPAS